VIGGAGDEAARTPAAGEAEESGERRILGPEGRGRKNRAAREGEGRGGLASGGAGWVLRPHQYLQKFELNCLTRILSCTSTVQLDD
jgi:hypothetical protein